MELTFFKYYGAGNDFVLVDNRAEQQEFSQAQIAQICHRRFGVGADGFMLLEEDPESHFRMKYYNSDGKEGSMCGNGGRCIVAFARFCGIEADSYRFSAVDGMHEAYFEGENVSLRMGILSPLNTEKQHAFANTGSPHIIVEEEDLEQLKIEEKAIPLRFDAAYNASGSNVNFISIKEDNKIDIRTYERGVEAETWACGTGAVAAALYVRHKNDQVRAFQLQAKGGLLEVHFVDEAEGDDSIWLKGNAVQAFRGFFQLD